MTIRKLEYKDLEKFFLSEIQPIKVSVNIGLSENQKKEIFFILKTLYADSFMLMVKTLDYHWNINGKLLNNLRIVTGEQYNELFFVLSKLSKRMKTLGFDVPGSIQQILEETRIQEKYERISPIAMVADLINDNENMLKFIRQEISVVYRAHDETTLNILRNRLETHENFAWKLRSLIEK